MEDVKHELFQKDCCEQNGERRNDFVKMKKSNLIVIGLIILLLGILVFSGRKQTGDVKEDVFEGVITNTNLEPRVLDGIGVYDRSCNPVENGLTQCDAGIKTEEGLLNFKYKHDMHAQGCLDQGQKLKVEVFAGGGAKVTRL